ncbi:MAG: YggS family pyridoxal phosphate-dependent enzyme [Proteobacteria bacterium]|nr:YggS family pyridoxal phosphate-dependent enzyme [Pseudomonadota bacterium]
MSELLQRIEGLRRRLDRAAADAGREPSSVHLIAVSKTFPATLVERAAEAGLRAFGENRVQEASDKIPMISDRYRHEIEWHFIGPLQRNKARRAVELCDVIHSVDRPALVDVLQRSAAALGRRPRVLVQVNVDREPQKAGADPDDAPGLVRALDACANLVPVGLMAIPRPADDPEKVRPAFARLRELRDVLERERGRELPELSMGMSADFEVAIQEGATWVRLGTAIFGERDKP